MDQAIIHELSAGLSVQAIRPMPSLAAWLEAEIDRLWAAVQRPRVLRRRDHPAPDLRRAR